MKITNIRESGANNTLLWAISNGANPRGDEQLTSLINDELFYLVTLSDVNFLELFRLTQMYREKLRIVNEQQAAIPLRKDLLTQFNGSYSPDKENPETKAPLYEIVEGALQMFLNIATQMGVDSDIINPSAQRLFVPMLCRKFDVQFPVGFYDFVSSMNEEEAAKIFTPEYPKTLNTILEAEVHGVKTTLSLGFVRGTQIIQYNPRYDQYMRLIKYAPLKTFKDEHKLYKFGLLGFHKYDNLTRGEVRCALTPVPPAKEQFAATLKLLNRLKTPLMVDFAVQMPIQQMQEILNTFGRDVLNVQYESTMAAIIEGGINYDDFTMPAINPETEDPDEQKKLEEFNNQVSAYKVRINEANQTTMSVLGILLENQGDIDQTGAFAMLPSIYNAKAVFTLDLSKAAEYESHYDPLITEMFAGMLGMAKDITNEISAS